MPPRITGPYSARPTEPEIPNQRKFADVLARKGQGQVLLVFSPSPAKTLYKQILSELEGRDRELADRHVEVLLVLETGRAPRVWNYLPGQQAVKARYKFDVQGAEFAVILVGRDGRVTRRWTEPPSFEDLTAVLRD